MDSFMAIDGAPLSLACVMLLLIRYMEDGWRKKKGEARTCGARAVTPRFIRAVAMKKLLAAMAWASGPACTPHPCSLARSLQLKAKALE